MPEVLNKCAHAGCRCPSPAGSYSSEYCKTAEAGTETDNRCGCGHPECRSKKGIAEKSS